jgi:TPR repeat protein
VVQAAAVWYEAAAEGGQLQATFRLAQCLRYGLGVDKQPEVAFDWIQKAATRAHADSQHELGEASLVRKIL